MAGQAVRGLGEPGQDGKVAMRIEGGHVHIAAVPPAWGRDPEQCLGRDTGDPRDPREVVGQATVDRLRSRLDGQQGGGQVHQRRRGDDEQVGAQTPVAGGHAPLDAEE